MGSVGEVRESAPQVCHTSLVTVCSWEAPTCEDLTPAWGADPAPFPGPPALRFCEILGRERHRKRKEGILYWGLQF